MSLKKLLLEGQHDKISELYDNSRFYAKRYTQSLEAKVTQLRLLETLFPDSSSLEDTIDYFSKLPDEVLFNPDMGIFTKGHHEIRYNYLYIGDFPYHYEIEESDLYLDDACLEKLRDSLIAKSRLDPKDNKLMKAFLRPDLHQPSGYEEGRVDLIIVQDRYRYVLHKWNLDMVDFCITVTGDGEEDFDEDFDFDFEGLNIRHHDDDDLDINEGRQTKKARVQSPSQKIRHRDDQDEERQSKKKRIQSDEMGFARRHEDDDDDDDKQNKKRRRN